MTDGRRQGIRRIFLGCFREFKDCAHHELYLVLTRVTVSRHNTLDICRWIVMHLDVLRNAGAEYDPSGLAENQSGVGVLRHERLLHGHSVRLVPGDYLAEVPVYLSQTHPQITGLGTYAAMINMANLTGFKGDDAEARDS